MNHGAGGNVKKYIEIRRIHPMYFFCQKTQERFVIFSKFCFYKVQCYRVYLCIRCSADFLKFTICGPSLLENKHNFSFLPMAISFFVYFFFTCTNCSVSIKRKYVEEKSDQNVWIEAKNSLVDMHQYEVERHENRKTVCIDFMKDCNIRLNEFTCKIF